MPVTKPTKYPEFASGGSAGISEPSGAKKLLGWIVEKPPYQFFNWLFNLNWQWVQWFDQGFKTVVSVTAAGATAVAYGTQKIYSDTTLGNQTLNLPDISTQVGGVYIYDGMTVDLTKISADANTATLDGFGSQAISDALTQVLANQYEAISITAFHGNWYI